MSRCIFPMRQWHERGRQTTKKFCSAHAWLGTRLVALRSGDIHITSKWQSCSIYCLHNCLILSCWSERAEVEGDSEQSTNMWLIRSVYTTSDNQTNKLTLITCLIFLSERLSFSFGSVPLIFSLQERGQYEPTLTNIAVHTMHFRIINNKSIKI